MPLRPSPVGSIVVLAANMGLRQTRPFAWDVPAQGAFPKPQLALGAGGTSVIFNATTGAASSSGAVAFSAHVGGTSAGATIGFTGTPIAGRPTEIPAINQAGNFIAPVSSNFMPFDPDPRIQGTKIPIYRISALFDGGMTIEQIAEDFPTLQEKQIVEAIEYAMAYPPPIRGMYPRESLKRLLLNSGFKNLKKPGKASRKRSGTGVARVYSGSKRPDHVRRQSKQHKRPEMVQPAG